MTLRDQLIGSWALVSHRYTQPDGTTVDGFGPNPKGLLIFSDDGYFSGVLMRSDLPKFKSDKRTAGTAEENKAVVSGSHAGFGTFSVSGNVLTLHMEACTFPNRTDTEQARTITVTGDELKWHVSKSTRGPGVEPDVVWRRVRK
jgi:Lipocalin-like domain